MPTDLRGIFPDYTNLESTASYTNLPVSVNEIGEWLNISPDGITAHTNLITDLIKSVVDIIQDYTWYDINRKSYISYFEFFDNGFFSGLVKLVLNKAPIIALTDITKVEYLDSTGTWINYDFGTASSADGLFANVNIKKELQGWASLYLKNTFLLSSEYNVYRVRVTYQTGYDLTTTNSVIPARLRLAIRKIVCLHWTTRGDIPSDYTLDGFPVSAEAKAIIDQFAISKTVFSDRLPNDFDRIIF